MIPLALVAATLAPDRSTADLPRPTEALPPGAVARIGSSRFHHPVDVRFLGTSADGKRVYTVEPYSPRDRPPDLFVWESDTGRLLTRRPLATGQERVPHVTFGASNIRAIVRLENGKTQTRIVDPATGRIIRTSPNWDYPPLVDHQNTLLPWSVSPNGCWLFQHYHPYKTIRLCNTETGAVVTVDTDEKFGSLYDPWFSSDGLLVCTASERGPIRIHSLPDCKLVSELPRPQPNPKQADGNPFFRNKPVAGFTPDGKGLAVWDCRQGEWTLYLHELGTSTRRVLLDKQAGPGFIHFSPDGKTYARFTGPDRGYHYLAHQSIYDWELRELATGRLLSTCPGDLFNRHGFSADGTTFFTQPGGRLLVPWDVRTGEPRSGAPSPLGLVQGVRFTPTGQLLGLAGGFAYTWDAATGRELARTRLRPVTRGPIVSGPVFSESGDEASFLSGDLSVVSWNLLSGANTVTPLANDGSVQSYHRLLMANGRLIEVRDEKALRVWSTRTGKVHRDVPLPEPPDRRRVQVSSLTVSNDGRRIATGLHLIPSDVKIQMFEKVEAPSSALLNISHLDGKDVVTRSIYVNTSIHLVEFSPDGRKVVLVNNRSVPAGSQLELAVVDAATGRASGPFPAGPGHAYLAKFSPDGRTLAISCVSQGVRLLETASWTERVELATTYIEGSGTAVSPDPWSPDGRLLVTRMPDDRLFVWDYRRIGWSGRGWPQSLDEAWKSLAADARNAFAAGQWLSSIPEQSIPFLARKLPPAQPPAVESTQALIAALGSADFKKRERASAELETLGRIAESTMREAVESNKSAEVTRRLQTILNRIAHSPPLPEELRAVRAVEAVEWIGTPDAVKLLRAWAGGAAGARLTEEAAAALARLRQKPR